MLPENVVAESNSINFSGHFSTYLRRIFKYRTVFYYNPLQEECWFDWAFTSDYALLLWRKAEAFYLKSDQDTDILVLACVPADQSSRVLHILSDILRHMREVKILLQFPLPENTTLITEILSFCHRHSMLNAVAIYSNFATTLRLYMFEAFPAFRLSTQLFNASVSIFPDKLENLYGYAIRTVVDQSEPNTIVQPTSPEGDTFKVSGIVWRALIDFTSQYNASLALVAKPEMGKILSEMSLLSYTRNRAVDIAAALGFMSSKSNIAYYDFSYPLFIGSWCTMLPVERPITTWEALSKILSTSTISILIGIYLCYILLPKITEYVYKRFYVLFVLYFLPRRSYQLRFTKPPPRLYRLILLQFSIILLCVYEAHLISKLMVPCQENKITTFDELQKTSIKIFGYRLEFSSYDTDIRIKYASLFRLTSFGYELVQQRNSLNDTQGYTVTSIKWHMYQSQLGYFKHPTFRYSKDLCIQPLSFFSLLQQQNSVFRLKLNQFITKLRQHGMLRHYYATSILDMIRAGRLQLKDLSSWYEPKPLHLKDLHNLFKLFALCMGFNTIVLLFEFIHYKINKLLDAL